MTIIPMALSMVGGLGLFMLGMKYMSEGMQAVAGGSLRRMISLVTDRRLMATGTGTAVTVLVQSSSVTTVIVVGLVNAGLMRLHQAVGVIMGANIGTTITVLIASVGANVNAKRAAYAHVLFNAFGVFWITPFGRLLRRLVPDPKVGEVPRLKHLEGPAVAAPVLGVEQSRGEVIQMGRGVVKMIDWIRQLGFNGPYDERLVQKTFHREEVLDNVQREIITFLTDLLDATVPHAIAEEGRRQLRFAHEYESMSDRLANVLRSYAELRERRLELAAERQTGLLALHDAVADFLPQFTEAYADRQAVGEDAARLASARIIRQVQELRDKHLQQMTDRPVDPSSSLLFTDILTDYRRVRAHTMNIQEAVTGTDATLPVSQAS